MDSQGWFEPQPLPLGLYMEVLAGYVVDTGVSGGEELDLSPKLLLLIEGGEAGQPKATSCEGGRGWLCWPYVQGWPIS